MKAVKPAILILVAVAALLVLGLRLGRDCPDEVQVQRDFMAEHPAFTVERIAVDEQEVAAVCYRIFYRTPGDSALHEELRQYLHTDGGWLITHRLQNR